MAAEDKTYHSKKSAYITMFFIVLSGIVVALTLLFACWYNGAFLPTWIDWKSYTAVIDTNGNGQEESLKLTNRHLTITDANGNRYVSPNEWLISDVHIGDITQDGTPEVLALVWKHNTGENVTYRIAGLGAISGFSQHICIFDYSSGKLETIWTSSPLRYEAQVASLDDKGKLQLTLPSTNNNNSWAWDDAGLILHDNATPLGGSSDWD